MSDDCLVSKKILPGFQFVEAGTKGIPRGSPWVARGKVSIKSACLMFDMVKSQHSSTRENLRKKLTRSELESKAAVAALACHLA